MYIGRRQSTIHRRLSGYYIVPLTIEARATCASLSTFNGVDLGVPRHPTHARPRFLRTIPFTHLSFPSIPRRTDVLLDTPARSLRSRITVALSYLWCQEPSVGRHVGIVRSEEACGKRLKSGRWRVPPAEKATRGAGRERKGETGRERERKRYRRGWLLVARGGSDRATEDRGELRGG